MTRSHWLAWGAGFAGACLALDAIVSRLIRHDPASAAYAVNHLIEERGGEIPIFGSSTVRYDYVPSAIGHDSYCYGFFGVGYAVIDELLQIELAKPKTGPVIIDLKTDDVREVGDLSAYVPFADQPHIRNILREGHALSWRYSVPGIRYFGYYGLYFKDLLNSRMQAVRQVDRGSSREVAWTYDAARLASFARQASEQGNGYFPDPDADRRLLASVEHHPRRLFILVYAPLHRSRTEAFAHEAQFEAYKRSLAAHANVVVLDYRQLPLPDEMFFDTQHLLYPGAVAFSRRLGADLDRILPGRAKSFNDLHTSGH